MIRTYFKAALRNLLKRKISTLINITGLAVGLACCTLVFLYFRQELAFDKGFDDAKNIYRITSSFRDGSRAPTVPLPYGRYLQQEIPDIIQVSRLDAKQSPCIVKAIGDTAAVPYLDYSGYWVDPNFFNLFSFHFLYGDRKTALTAPNTVVLSETTAEWLFHGRYPLGRQLKAGNTVYTVSGVFKEDLPNHIGAHFFASNNSDSIREGMAKILNWVADPNYYTYVRLRPGANVAKVIDKLQAYTERHASADMKASGNYMENSLQALSDIHLHSAGYYDYLSGKQGNLSYLYLLASIAAAILLLGCINYMNLSTAQAIDRAREVGVRRVLGAAKKSIRRQFLFETVFISLLAMLLGIGLTVVFLPAFNDFTGQQLSLFSGGNFSFLYWLLPAALVTGILAGVYPAVYLSSFRPVKVLKDNRGDRWLRPRKERGTKLRRWSVSDPGALLNVRKVLVAGQFVIATGLMIATMVIWKQLQYMMEAKIGVDETQQLVIRLTSDQAATNRAYYMQRLKANPDFQQVISAADPVMSGDMSLYPADKSVNDKRDLFLNLVDEHYIPAMGLQLVAGTNFTPMAFATTDMQQDSELNDIGRQVILNQSAVRALGYDDRSAVGKQLARTRNGVVNHYTIIGVVRDYHFLSLHNAITPFALMPANPRRFTTIIARVRSREMSGAISYASAQWRAVNADSPFSCDFLSNVFRYDYAADRREQQMMSAFTVIAILISCLGVLGLITYSVGQKAREIGIRKVIGASVADIVLLFSRQYLRLILIANLITAPVAWYVMHRWLQTFPYRIELSWWMFALALGMGCVVTMVALGFKTVKAAMGNPVRSLRGGVS